MNIKFNIQSIAVLGMAMVFASCQNTDTEAPTVCTEAGVMNSILADEIEGEAGDHLDIEDSSDNEGLSQFADIHSGEGQRTRSLMTVTSTKTVDIFTVAQIGVYFAPSNSTAQKLKLIYTLTCCIDCAWLVARDC